MDKLYEEGWLQLSTHNSSVDPSTIEKRCDERRIFWCCLDCNKNVNILSFFLEFNAHWSLTVVLHFSLMGSLETRERKKLFGF